MKSKKIAFTLVELIIVITILAILGTIAFISLQGYSSQSRDSTRISDISTMKTSLELFQLDAGKYPLVTDGIDITYSGSITWSQGFFGESTYKNVDILDKVPLDPLIDKKYVYSTTNTRQEFQIAGVLEGNEVSVVLSPMTRGELRGVSNVNAGEKTALVKISGNYNGKLLKVSTGGIDYILAIPSIVSSTGATLLTDIVGANQLAYNGYKNLPYQYEGSKYKILGEDGLNIVNSSDLVVYSGSLSTLSSAEQVGINARTTLLSNLQNAYIGTTIQNVGEINRILSTNLGDTTDVELLSTTIVSNNLGGSIIASGGNSDEEVVIVNTTPPSDYIAYYPLTGTADDETGNYNGIENGGLTYVNDVDKGAVASFDGSNDSINGTTALSGITNITLSAWYYTSDVGTNGTIYSDHNINFRPRSIFVFNDRNGNSDITYKSGYGLKTNQWVHFLVTVSSDNTINVYEDNVDITNSLTDNSAVNINWTGLNEFEIGKDLNGAYDFFNGNISSLRIYDRVLSYQEITNIYNTELNTNPIVVSDGLVAYYPLKSNSKDNWFNQYDGISEVGISYKITNGVASVYNNEATNDDNAYIDIPTNFTGTTGYSISFWHYLPQYTQGLFGEGLLRWVGLPRTFSLHPSIGQHVAYSNKEYPSLQVNDNGIQYSAVNKASLGWNNWMIDFNVSGTYVYLNGELVITAPAITNSFNIDDLQISLRGGDDSGSWSEFRFYNKSISLEEISEIFNIEKGEFGL